jgi:hypothetical protein
MALKPLILAIFNFVLKTFLRPILFFGGILLQKQICILEISVKLRTFRYSYQPILRQKIQTFI